MSICVEVGQALRHCAALPYQHRACTEIACEVGRVCEAIAAVSCYFVGMYVRGHARIDS